MSETRLSDAEFAEVAAAIPYAYEAGDYPAALSDRARTFLGPDGGLFSLIAELSAERQRFAAATHRAVPEADWADRIGAAALRSYLEVNDWSPRRPGPGGTLWVKGDVRIGVPHDLDSTLVAGVVRRLALAEDREVHVVVDAILPQQAPISGSQTVPPCDPLTRLSADFTDLVRLALDRRHADVVMFARRCAYRYRRSLPVMADALGDLLREHPANPLRGLASPDSPPSAT